MAVMPGDPLQQATDATSSDPMGEVETGAEDDGKPPVYRVKADFQYDGALGISWVPDPETGRPVRSLFALILLFALCSDKDLNDTRCLRLSRTSRKILRHRTNRNCESG